MPSGLVSQTPRRVEQVSKTRSEEKEEEETREKSRLVKLERYREKKKTRTFGNTVRYASRRAFAQGRARINGRFAPRPDFHAG